MKKSIKIRVVFLYITLVFIVMIVSGTVMLLRVRSEHVEKEHANFITIRKMAVDNVFSNFEEIFNTANTAENAEQEQVLKNFEEFKRLFMKTTTGDVEVFILTPTGGVLDSTLTQDGSYIASLSTITNVIVSAMDGKESFSSGTQYEEKTYLEYGYPYPEDSDNIKYILYIREDTKDLQGSLELISYTIAISSCIALFLAAVIGLLFAGTLTSPILTLTKKATELAEGNFQQEIPVESRDEIGKLTENFNYMAKTLNETIATTESEKNKLEILLHNMTDGVLAYDSLGKLIHANQVSLELLETDEIAITELKTILEKFDINLDKTSNDENEYTIQIGDKYISAIFSTYTDINGKTSGYVTVLQDVTKYKKLDNMRKEFVANVSHEMRTPLATIKGYSETLLDGALENKEIAESFLGIIESEADRMALLVQDLLELTRFDNLQFSLNVTEINLVSLVHEVIIQNTFNAEQKKQKIIFEKPSGSAIINGDYGRIVQVRTNIISNAVKYSVEEGTITITIQETDENYFVSFKDSGIGIPKEDLEHIFERFYRVDKARSRQMGGTGLGLSIAKEIMELHGGRIYVTSETSQGSEFVLKFDKNFTKEWLDNK